MLQTSPLDPDPPAGEVPRARRFYDDTLGLQPGLALAGGVMYTFGSGIAAFVSPTPNAGPSQASHAFWQVNDIEREVTQQKQRGIVFEDDPMEGEKSPSGVVAASGANAARFKDSEGNIVAIIQSAAERQP